MMKGKTGIAILLFIVLQFMQSCTDRKSESYTFDDVPLVIDLDSVKQDSLKISSIRYIPLETSEECLIGEPSKVMIRDHKIYVADFHTAKALFVFDLEGRFLFKIARMGQAVDEYISFHDFDLQPNGDIYMFDQNSRKFLIFNSSGEYVRHIFSDYYFSCFCSIDHKMYWSKLRGAGKMFANLAVYDELTEKVEFVWKDDPFLHELELFNFSSHGFYSSPDHGIYYAPKFSEVIYAIDENGVFPAIGVKNLKMPTKQVMDEWLREKNPIERTNRILKTDYFIEHAYIYETDTYITWGCMTGGYHSEVLFYNKEAKQACFVYSSDLSRTFGVDKIKGSTGSEFFTIVHYDPENYRHKEILAKNDELVNWTAEDNSVVVIFNVDM